MEDSFLVQSPVCADADGGNVPLYDHRFTMIGDTRRRRGGREEKEAGKRWKKTREKRGETKRKEEEGEEGDVR